MKVKHIHSLIPIFVEFEDEGEVSISSCFFVDPINKKVYQKSDSDMAILFEGPESKEILDRVLNTRPRAEEETMKIQSKVLNSLDSIQSQRDSLLKDSDAISTED